MQYLQQYDYILNLYVYQLVFNPVQGIMIRYSYQLTEFMGNSEVIFCMEKQYWDGNTGYAESKEIYHNWKSLQF